MPFVAIPTDTLPVIDLRGPDGCASALQGVARRLCEGGSYNVEAIISEMRQDGYLHMVMVFGRHFGGLVDIVVPRRFESELVSLA